MQYVIWTRDPGDIQSSFKLFIAVGQLLALEVELVAL